MSELSDFVDDAVLNWLSQRPMTVTALAEVSRAGPPHLRASLRRLLRAGKIRRFRRNAELIYTVADGSREI